MSRDSRHSYSADSTDDQLIEPLPKPIVDDSLNADGQAQWQHGVYRPTTVTVRYQKRKGFTRYKPSLKYLLPVRIKQGPKVNMPVDYAGCCSFVWSWWLVSLIWKAFRKGIQQTDVYLCSPVDGSRVNGARLALLWDQELKRNEGEVVKSSLRRTIWKFISTRVIIACLFYVLCLLFGFLGPTIFTKKLLEYAESPETDYLSGALWMIGLFACELVRLFFYALTFSVNVRTGLRASAGAFSLLYSKLLQMRWNANKSAGELLNTFANDFQRVYQMVHSAPMLLGGPLLAIGSVVYQWMLIGPFSLVGVGVVAVTYLIQFGVAHLSNHFQKKAIRVTDERVRLISEMITNIKFIKLYAWEQPFSEMLTDHRKKERGFLMICQYLHSLSISISMITHVIATIFTILVYTLTDHSITASEAFTILLVNAITSHGIRMLPMCIRDMVNGRIALRRIENFLQMENYEDYVTVPINPEHAIYINKATLAWDNPVLSSSEQNHNEKKKGEINLTVIDNEKNSNIDGDPAGIALVPSPPPVTPTLRLDSTVAIPKGKLVGVCGTVGSGKSSLIAALLGQMRLLNGQVAVRGTCAYVAQQSWIMNASVRANITFGHPFDKRRYYEAVYCCSLTEDISVLPAGDDTEVGDRGITLSGGQKQRISLARAFYANCDVYLLDDPLSAVDPTVGQHIFQHCIKNALKGKTIIFVSHQLQYLQECDMILIMRDGQITEMGTHQELVQKNEEYASLLESYQAYLSLQTGSKLDDSDSRATDSPSFDRSPSPFGSTHSPSLPRSKHSSLSDLEETNIPSADLTTPEAVEQGNISYDTYEAYIKAAGGYIICLLVLVWFVLHAATANFTIWWLGHWISQGAGEGVQSPPPPLEGEMEAEYVPIDPSDITANPDLDFYQLVYGTSVAALVFISLVLGYLSTKATLRASSKLHDKAFYRVIRSPMHFFETIPTGRILNIFTRDVNEVDVHVPSLLDGFLQRLIFIIFNFLLVCIVFPWFTLPLLAICCLFLLLQRMFRAAMRDFKRIENVTRSPIYSHVATSLQGMATILAFKKQDEFTERFADLVDANISPLYLYVSSTRWFASHMDFACILVTLITALFTIFFKESVGAAYAGLAITLAMQVSSLFQFVIRLGCDVETRFTSVERINSYIERLESEAPLVVEKDRPSPHWPPRGRISFRDVNLRYRPGLPFALKNITFDISPQEKIGIVGRTGAGKSSIGAALFRLVELSSGSIHIDNVDISHLGLEDLRSRMSIIPQDPVIFQGTVRYNLDPCKTHEDSELWDVLEKSHLKDKVSSLKGGLDAQLLEGGENFSLGEKQLLCLARALLRQTKVVILDEATASVDTETEGFIQLAIKEVLADCTVLIVAHRLQTVLICDRVMVLDNGLMVEFDAPDTLLSNRKSLFSQLCASSTLSNENC